MIRQVINNIINKIIKPRKNKEEKFQYESSDCKMKKTLKPDPKNLNLGLPTVKQQTICLGLSIDINKHKEKMQQEVKRCTNIANCIKDEQQEFINNYCLITELLELADETQKKLLINWLDKGYKKIAISDNNTICIIGNRKLIDTNIIFTMGNQKTIRNWKQI